MIEFIEKRKHVRVYFEEPALPLGEVEIDYNNDYLDYEILPCMIWGLSAGGIRLSINRKRNFAKGDLLTLNRIEAPTMTGRTLGNERLQLEVGWCMHKAKTGRTYLGCRFIGLSENGRAFLSDIIRHGMQETSMKFE